MKLTHSFLNAFIALALSLNLHAEEYTISKLSENAAVHTDSRPVNIGFYDPASNKTFVTWMGSFCHPIVKEFDHTTQKWTEDKIIGNSPFEDKHNYPEMIKGIDNKLYVFYGCHNSTLKMAKSPNPLSISGTWEDRFIPEAQKASYPAPVATSEGTIYVFYRETRQTNGYSDDRPYCLVKSTDNGASWKKQMIIDNYPRFDNYNEIYNGKVTYEPAHGNQKAKIHLAWTVCGGGPGKHAHATFGRNVYYAYLDPSNDHMYNIEGKDLGTTLSDEESETFCKVIDTGAPARGHSAGLQITVHYRDNGTPLIIFDRQSVGFSSATWTGSTWNIVTITKSASEPKELSKFGPDSFKAYKINGKKVEVYRTIDGGLNWNPETSFTAEVTLQRCFVIDNYNCDTKLLLIESINDHKNVKQANRDVFIGKALNCEKPYTVKR